MAAEIGIKIGADISGLVSGAKAAGTAINSIGESVRAQEAAFASIGESAKQAYQKIADAANKANGGGNTFKPFGQGFDPGPTLRSLNEIEAEIKRVNAAIGANKDISQFQKLDAELSKLELEARNLRAVGFEKTFGNIGPSAAQGALGMNRLRVGSNEAGFALQNVGRVAQDLPFGFIGIQNNLNPLLESFQRLKASTGSTGLALKALGGSMLGAGGLGLALSVVSAAILIFQNGIGGFNKKTTEAKAKADEFKKSLEGIVNTIADEATRVTVLVSALQSETTSRKEKKAAIEELKKINPEYFGQLNQEKGLIDQLKIAYLGYIDSLKQQFAAKALDKQLSELFNKKLDLEIRLTPTISTAGNQQISAQIATFQKQIEKLDPGATLRNKPFLTLTDAEFKIIDKINNLKSAINSIQTPIQLTSKSDNDELKKTNEQIDSLIKRRAELGNFKITVPKDPKGPTDESELNKQITAINKQISALEELQKQGNATKLDIQELFTLKIKKLELELPKSGFDTNQFIRFKNQLEVDADAALRDIPFTTKIPKIDVKIDTEAALKSAQAAGKGAGLVLFTGLADGIKTVDVGKGLNEAIQQNLAPAIENVAASLGEAFTGGGFGAVLKAVANSIGQFIQDFGKILIKGALEILALKKIASVIAKNPAVALVLGIAAVAIGAAIKNSLGGVKQKGFAQGGIADGPSSGYLALLHGKEVIAPYSQAAALLGGGNNGGGGGTVIFEIAGNNLRGVLNKANKSAGRGLT